MGCALLWAPFYAIGDVAARMSGAPIDGFSKPYVAAVAYGSAVYGFLAIAIAIVTARQLGFDGWWAGLAIWLGTPLLFYMYVAPVFAHACSAFAVALFLFVWLRVRERWTVRGGIALGAAAALMAMVREQDAFFAAGAALDFVLLTPGTRGVLAALRHRAATILAAAAAFVVVYTPQAAAYLALNGHIGPHSSVGRKMNWIAPHALQVLFSPEHGFFFWTPLALIAIGGLAFFAWQRDLPTEGRSAGALAETRPVASGFSRKRSAALALCLMVVLQVYVGGSVESWTVAGGFGQRRFIALTAVMVVGYAAIAFALRARSRYAPRALAALTILAIYWNLALSAEFATGLMDRQKLEPRKNAYDAFVTLPAQAPSLIYRYLFDRASFYQQRGTP
jgi:hypothetical protein